MTTTHDLLQQVMGEVTAATTGAFLNGDPGPLKESWSHADDVTIFGGYGSSEHGWDQVGPRLDWAASRFHAGEAHYEAIASGASGDLAYAIGIERGRVQVAGMTEHHEHALRVTHLYRREHGAWKLIHRHADPLTSIAP